MGGTRRGLPVWEQLHSLGLECLWLENYFETYRRVFFGPDDFHSPIYGLHIVLVFRKLLLTCALSEYRPQPECREGTCAQWLYVLDVVVKK